MRQIRMPRGVGFASSRKLAPLIGAALLLALLLAAQLALPTSETPSRFGGQTTQSHGNWTPSYRRDVAPILERACIRCHGPQRADKGLRLDSYRGVLAGDSYGAVVIPGESSLSAVVSVVKYGTMPHQGMRLPPAEIDIISRWIDNGAQEN